MFNFGRFSFRGRKGMYEYVLTKSVMLIFIMGLVATFMMYRSDLDKQSAERIADYEANRIAKIIDDAIGFKGVSNTITVNLKNDLKVGADIAPYSFEISDKGVILIKYEQYPYKSIVGMANFGIELQKKAGSCSASKIDCDWKQLSGVASFRVEKKAEWEYSTTEDALYYVVTIKIDASEDCYECMEFEQRFIE